MPTPIAIANTNQTPNSEVVVTVDRLGKPWNFSEKGILFLKNYEKFSPTMYNDATNNATIGYGYKIHSGPISGDKSETSYINGITEAGATKLLLGNLDEYEKKVNHLVKVPLFQHEYDAIVIFCYNIGIPAFTGSGALKKINQGKYSDVPEEMMKWNKGKVNGQLVEVKGLTNRRTEEVEIFKKADYVRQR